MATQAGVAYVTVAYDPVGVQKLRAATKAQGDEIASSFATSATRAGKSLRSVGASLTKNVSLPAGVAAYAAIKLATDFDTSLNHIQALVGANTKQMAVYRKSILDLAPAVGVGPKELSDALYFITSSGFKGAQALDVLKASAKGAAAGLGSTQDVANIATSAVSAYGAATITASQAVDVLTATVREGKGDPAELADALGQNIGVAQQLGISFDQVGAAMSALTLVSPNVAEDATQLSGVMSGLLKPTTQAQAEMKKLGFSAQGLRDSLKTKGLLPTLLELKDATKGNQDALGKLFPNIRALRGFLALTGQQADKNVGIFDRLAKSTGDTNDAFKAASGTESLKFKQALADLQVAAINLGEQLIPLAVSIAGVLASMAEGFSGLSPEMQKVAAITLIIAAGLGPLIGLIAAVTTAVGFLAGGFELLAGAEIAAEAGIAPWAAALTIIVGASVLLGGALADLTGGMGGLSDATGQAEAATRGLTAAFRDANDDARSAARATLERKDAALRLTDAQKAVTALEKQGKKGTEEYRKAVLDAKGAELDLTDAIQREKDAHNKANATRKGAWKNVDTLRGKVQTLVGALHDEEKRLNTSSGAMDKNGQTAKLNAQYVNAAANKFQDLADKAFAAAGKLKSVNKAASDAAKKIAIAEQVTGDLARALDRLPTQKEINVYVTTHTSDRKLRKRAAGGPVDAGTTYLVGEQGPELFTAPTNGQITPNNRLASQITPYLPAVGAAGDTYVMVKIGERDITDIVDTRVERRAKSTSRRVRAGSKWGN